MGLLNLFEIDPSGITLFARAAIFATWLLALLQILKSRFAPLANQAFVASLTIVLVQILLIFHEYLPTEGLVFFVSMAQVVLAISIVKIARWASHLTESEYKRIHFLEKQRTYKQNLLAKYGKCIVIVSLAGFLYFVLAWMAQGGY